MKVPGGGVYLVYMHAVQGDGEIARHTCDTSGTVSLQVHLLKGLNIDRPILFPILENLPFVARPLSAKKQKPALMIAKAQGTQLEESAGYLAWV